MFFANYRRRFHSNGTRGEGAELGLRAEIVPRLQTSLAFWRLDSDSELTYIDDSGTTDLNGVG